MNKQKTIGIIGWQNSGKTTMITELIAYFTECKISVSTVKQTHHDFEIDKKGKDSDLHRQSGASEVLISSPHRWAIIHENKNANDSPKIEDLLNIMKPVDILLVEGYKQGSHPKISIYRKEADNSPLLNEAENIVAIATNTKLDTDIPQLDINNIKAIADFILRY